MKKQFLLFSLVLLFSFSFISAISFVPTSPNVIDIKCGESRWIPITLNNVDTPSECPIVKLPYRFPHASGLDGLFLSIEDGDIIGDSGFILNILCSIDKNDCEEGQEIVNFDVCGTNYQLTINVAEKGFQIFNERLYEDEKINIGSSIELIPLEILEDAIKYRLIGCGDDKNREGLEVNESETYECGGETLSVKLIRVSSSYMIFDISASQNWLTSISDSDERDYDENECILGIDTSQTIVKRGKLFSFKSINTVTGTPIPNIVVTIIDPGGEVVDYSAKSNYIGYFSYKLSEEYKESHIIVQLVDMDENCEPEPLGRYDFEKSYDDYIKAKQDEEGEYKLVLDISGRFPANTVITNTIKNALGEVIEGATVRITFSDNSFIDLVSDSNGVISFTPSQIGINKLQCSKDGYVTTEMSEIEIYLDQTYFIDIKRNGESKPGPYKVGDILTFEIKSLENDTLIPLTIDANIYGLPLKFIGGISDPLTFEGEGTLIIPSTEGYIEYQLTLYLKETSWNWLWYILIGIGGIVIIIILILIVRKFKNGSTSPKQQMEIQLGDVKGEQND